MSWANERPIYVDPPSGWMYGFPKLWDGKTPIKVWLVENGYPEKMANENRFVRFISAKAGKEDDTAE